MEEGILKKNGIAILKGEIIAFIINIFGLIILSLMYKPYCKTLFWGSSKPNLLFRISLFSSNSN